MAYLNDKWITTISNDSLRFLEQGSTKPGAPLPVGKTPRAIVVSMNMIDVYTANMGANSVSRITNGKRIGDILVGKAPMGICENSKGHIYVACFGSNDVYKIIDGKVVSRIVVGNGPRGICIDQDDNVWVAMYLDNMVYRLVNDIVVDKIPVGINPYGICVDLRKNVYCTNSGSNTVSKIKGIAKVKDIDVGKMPYGIVCDANGIVWVANFLGDSISRIVNDTAQPEVPAGDGPHGIGYDKDGVVYVANSLASTMSRFGPDGQRMTDIEVGLNPVCFGDFTGMVTYTTTKVTGTVPGNKKIKLIDLDDEVIAYIGNQIGKKVRAEDVIYDNGDYPELGNVDTAIDKLLYKAPNITFTNTVGIAEVGSTVTAVTLNWNCDKTIKKQLIDGVEVPVGDRSKQLTAQTIKSNKIWTLTITDMDDKTYDKATMIDFQNKRYFGASALETLTDADILGLGKEFATSRNTTKVFDATGGKYIYFAVPSAFGCDINKFKIGGLSNSDWVKTTIDFKNASGAIVKYDVFRSTYRQTGSAITVEIV